MSDDSETVEDTEKCSVTEMTDASCTVKFIEIVPLDGESSDDYHKLRFIDPVFQVKPEDLHELKQEAALQNDIDGSDYFVKQEPADENDIEGQNYSECETEDGCFTTQVC